MDKVCYQRGIISLGTITAQNALHRVGGKFVPREALSLEPQRFLSTQVVPRECREGCVGGFLGTIATQVVPREEYRRYLYSDTLFLSLGTNIPPLSMEIHFSPKSDERVPREISDFSFGGNVLRNEVGP